MIIRHKTVLRFTLVEMALALAVLGVGLSAVLLLSTIGAKAGRDSRTEGDLEGVAGRMTVFLQGRFSTPQAWKADGTQTEVIPDFNASPADGDVPVGDGGFSPVPGEDGILAKNVGTYICRRSSGVDGTAADFEAMVRVGTDKSFWENQFYVSASDRSAHKLSAYPRNRAVPVGTRINGASAAAMFGKFHRPLIAEISWPVGVEWSKREKRYVRLELFNENFIPYPQD